MASVTVPSIYGELIEYLAERATPAEILAFKPSESAQGRAEMLLEKNSNGTLTPDERLELDQMLHFDRIVSSLKAKALEQSSHI